METQTEHGVTLTREIDAPAKAIYAAWTDPEFMRTWFAQVVEADGRVGGAYRIENHEEDGSISVHRGRYLILDPGKRMVMTFHNDDTPTGDFEDETVSVTLRPLDADRTELTLTHAWNDTELTFDELDALRAGWSIWLDLLVSALAVVSPGR